MKRSAGPETLFVDLLAEEAQAEQESRRRARRQRRQDGASSSAAAAVEIVELLDDDDDEGTVPCGICFDDAPFSRTRLFSACGHRFCDSCSRMHVKMKIVDGQVR